MIGRKRIIVIVGPTAVGKTGLAVKLAKIIKGEIISADSMQAYRGMGIISQEPTRPQQKAAKHHLISFLKPQDEYSAAEFSGRAGEIIRNIIKKRKTPIVLGGSGLYVKALIDGLFPSKGKDEGIRRRLENLARRRGSAFLYERLKERDPLSAQNIHPNDSRRIIRALEICEVEKKTKTSLKKKTRGIKDEYDIYFFGLAMPRDELYEKINKRVDSMFKRGLVREVRRLLRKKMSMTSKQALGIKEIEGYLKKEYSLEKAKETVKRNTRRFAKRQFTWFRADRRVTWLDIGMGEDKAIDNIVQKLA